MCQRNEINSGVEKPAYTTRLLTRLPHRSIAGLPVAMRAIMTALYLLSLDTLISFRRGSSALQIRWE
jgi:hypothetical protein